MMVRENEAPSADPPSGRADGWAAVRTRATALRCVVSGVAAWIITVLPVLVSARPPVVAKVAAVSSLLACLLGTRMIALRPRVARGFGVVGFVALSAAAWALVRDLRGLGVVEPVRGLLGALAWAIYAASWSHPWSLPNARLTDAPSGDAAGLAARRKPPRGALALGALGPFASVGCLALALEVDEPSRAVWARALGVLAAITLTSGSANLAVAASRDDRAGLPERWPIDGSVVRSLLVVGLLVAAMAVIDVLR